MHQVTDILVMYVKWLGSKEEGGCQGEGVLFLC